MLLNKLNIFFNNGQLKNGQFTPILSIMGNTEMYILNLAYNAQLRSM